jgi:hypothetical protein
VDLGFGPGEWFGVLVVGLDEGIERMLAMLLRLKDLRQGTAPG